ncbi:MAG: hypothetical protein RI946_1515 [Pseudomonadota bacterium]|jgi:Flp pilus assembly pilin Flp
MLNLIQNFRNDESGAVTVDWVVLTAAVIALGVAAYGKIKDTAMNINDRSNTEATKFVNDIFTAPATEPSTTTTQ